MCLEKKDSITLLPTGAGKTIIYTVLGICLKGISNIKQPHKALMEEQVFSMRQKGVTCYFINRSISAQQRKEIINILTNKDVEYALLFTDPELVTDEQLKDCLKVLHTQDRFTLLSVDEAHCIDLWGERSLREKYSKLDFLKNYNVPILALTGTATDRTVNIVTNSLRLDNPVITKM